MSVIIEIFTSPNCPYCTPIIEFVEGVVEDMGNIAKIEITDVRKNYHKALKCGVYAVPTLVINGRVKFVGKPDKESLLNAIKKEL